MTLKKINKKLNNTEQPKIFFWSLLLVILLGIFSYGYFVHAAIVNIVARQNMENSLSTLNSKVTTLESEYIKAKDDVTPEMAQTEGFIAVTNQIFINKANNTSASLSVNIQ